MNPASAFKRIRVYEGVYRQAARLCDLGNPLNYPDPSVKRSLLTLDGAMAGNQCWAIADARMASYNDKACDVIIYTNASSSG